MTATTSCPEHQTLAIGVIVCMPKSMPTDSRIARRAIQGAGLYGTILVSYMYDRCSWLLAKTGASVGKKKKTEKVQTVLAADQVCPCCKKHCPLAKPKCSKGEAVRKKLARS